ncbi:hypothetical protein pdam_00007370, partial [Pocillopora damicornis]
MSLHVFLRKTIFPNLVSSSASDKNHTARHAWLHDIASLRSLKTPKNSWCASGNSKKAELLILDLGFRDYSISAISTQGAVTEKSWVSSYLVYLRSQHEFLYQLADDKGNIKEFEGNTDQSSIVRHWLKPHLHAALLVLYPTSYVGRMCMSVEIYGCRTDDISMLTPFSSKQRQREEPIRCNLPKQPGNCKASFPRWFFNKETKQCEPFSYGGCHGNLNNFLSEYDCWKGCRDCKKRCHPTFSRCVNNNRSEEECECIQECPKVMKEVCGSDNVTYDNECQLKKAACEKYTEIEIVDKGPCT